MLSGLVLQSLAVSSRRRPLTGQRRAGHRASLSMAQAHSPTRGLAFSTRYKFSHPNWAISNVCQISQANFFSF